MVVDKLLSVRILNESSLDVDRQLYKIRNQDVWSEKVKRAPF